MTQTSISVMLVLEPDEVDILDRLMDELETKSQGRAVAWMLKQESRRRHWDKPTKRQKDPQTRRKPSPGAKPGE